MQPQMWTRRPNVLPGRERHNNKRSKKFVFIHKRSELLLDQVTTKTTFSMFLIIVIGRSNFSKTVPEVGRARAVHLDVHFRPGNGRIVGYCSGKNKAWRY